MDVNVISRIVSGSYIVDKNGPEMIVGDLNGDGNVNSIDVNIMKRRMAGV